MVGEVPWPAIVTRCGSPGALSAMTRTALRTPTARGPNSTKTVQLVSCLTGNREQVSSTILKSPAFAPSRMMRVTRRGAVPTLVTWTWFGIRARPTSALPKLSAPGVTRTPRGVVRAASRVVEQQQAGLAHSALTWSELHHDLAGLARSDPPSRAVLALDLEVAQLSRARPHAADHEGSRADISHAHGLRRSGPAHLPAAEVGGIRRDFHPWQRRRLSPGLHGASQSHLMGAAHGVVGEQQLGAPDPDGPRGEPHHDLAVRSRADGPPRTGLPRHAEFRRVSAG